MAPSAVAYRKPWFAAIAVVGVVGLSGAFAGISLAHPNGSDLFGAVILSLFAWFFWLVGGCLMYGGSLAGQLSGYPYTRKVAERMRRTQAELSPAAPETRPGPTGSRDVRHVSPWPPLLILGILELIAVLALLAR
jgi:hypothetical protein